VKQKYLGLIMGKNKQNIFNKEQEHGVRIFCQGSEESESAQISIWGPSEELIRQVFSEIHLDEAIFEVHVEKVDYVKGPKFANLPMFKEKAGLHSLYMKNVGGEAGPMAEGPYLQAVGNEEALDNFKIIFNAFLRMYDSWREAYQEEDRAAKSLYLIKKRE